MIISAPDRLMTSEEFVELPDIEGVTRKLINGKLIEIFEDPMTKRNPDHSTVLINVGTILKIWVRKQPAPRGRVVGGEAYCRLHRKPDINVGVDVAYLSPKLAASTPRRRKFVDGPPTLAVEVLSPYDKREDVAEAVRLYLDNGVRSVWIVDPFDCTVKVYRKNREPEAFNVKQVIRDDPALPGLRASVAEIFEY
jgi:Uma2 family endonuclease